MKNSFAMNVENTSQNNVISNGMLLTKSFRVENVSCKQADLFFANSDAYAI